jgi:hypothetical protein
MAPATIVAGAPVASFATRIAMLHRGIDALAIDPDGWLRFGDDRLPLARDGSLALRFRSPDPPVLPRRSRSRRCTSRISFAPPSRTPKVRRSAPRTDAACAARSS